MRSMMRGRGNPMAKFFTLTMALGVLVAVARLTAQQPETKASPEHEILKESEGTWDATVKSMGGESKGTFVTKMGLNGLWLLEHFKGDFGGMTFEGRGATTYDAAKKKYINIWIDSMSTSPMISEGGYDKATKTMTMTGTMATPDSKSTKVILTTVTKDANTRVFTLKSAGVDGKDLEMIQITYKRRAK